MISCRRQCKIKIDKHINIRFDLKSWAWSAYRMNYYMLKTDDIYDVVMLVKLHATVFSAVLVLQLI